MLASKHHPLRQPASVTGISFGPHEVAAEVLLGSESIVSVASQRKIGRVWGPSLRMRIEVVQLEKRSFTAASSSVNVGTTCPVPLPHLAFDGS